MFRDRRDAGVRLAEKLRHYKEREGVVVLALPRGGVVTGFEVARHLRAPLDVLIVRKIGAPWQPELAIGAISETGTVVLNQRIISAYGIQEKYISDEISRQKEEIARRIKLYRKEEKIIGLAGKTIIIVDDGVATGATIKAAIAALKKERSVRLIAALPVSPPETAEEIKKMTDEFICLEIHGDFMAVGNYYDDFIQVSDEEVVGLLKEAETWGPSPSLNPKNDTAQ